MIPKSIEWEERLPNELVWRQRLEPNSQKANIYFDALPKILTAQLRMTVLLYLIIRFNLLDGCFPAHDPFSCSLLVFIHGLTYANVFDCRSFAWQHSFQ